jgi:uncharacterized protein YycO
MRHSSVKTLVAALTISATVLAAVPAVAAGRANQGSRTQTTRPQDQSPVNDRFGAVRDFIQRAIRRVVTNGDGMTVPVPKNVKPPAEQD